MRSLTEWLGKRKRLRRALRTDSRLVVAFGVLGLGCATTQGYYETIPRCNDVVFTGTGAHDVHADFFESCESPDEARTYVAQVRERVLEVWEPPTAEDARVQTVFALDMSGDFQCLTVESEGNGSLHGSIVTAFRRTSPGPLPQNASCLSERRLYGSFTVRSQ